MRTQTIIISFEHPAIPTRNYDWRSGYSGSEEDGKDGFGATPAEALQDLLANYIIE